MALTQNLYPIRNFLLYHLILCSEG